MGERFKRDPNNGYPRYLGVRATPAAPAQGRCQQRQTIIVRPCSQVSEVYA
jgi:hypothetical protein